MGREDAHLDAAVHHSENPVGSMGMTGTPASSRIFAVPPVEITSTPNSFSKSLQIHTRFVCYRDYTFDRGLSHYRSFVFDTLPSETPTAYQLQHTRCEQT